METYRGVSVKRHVFSDIVKCSYRRFVLFILEEISDCADELEAGSAPRADLINAA